MKTQHRMFLLQVILSILITVILNVPLALDIFSLIAKGINVDWMTWYWDPTNVVIINLWNIGSLGAAFTLILFGIRRLKKSDKTPAWNWKSSFTALCAWPIREDVC